MARQMDQESSKDELLPLRGGQRRRVAPVLAVACGLMVVFSVVSVQNGFTPSTLLMGFERESSFELVFPAYVTERVCGVC